MIIEVEDRFCKAAQVFSQMLVKLERAAKRGAPVHEVEESAFSDLLEMGRRMITAFIEETLGSERPLSFVRCFRELIDGCLQGCGAVLGPRHRIVDSAVPAISKARCYGLRRVPKTPSRHIHRYGVNLGPPI